MEGVVGGNMGSMGGTGGASVNRILGEGRWWEAFGTGGIEGEAPLLEGESEEGSSERRGSEGASGRRVCGRGGGWGKGMEEVLEVRARVRKGEGDGRR